MAVDDEPVVTVKEFESWIVTCGWVLNTAPLLDADAATLLESLVAAAEEMTTVFVATVNPPAE